MPDELTVAIIPCTAQKADTPGPARDVWTGTHFQLILAHAELFYSKVLVMSYKYGLISPDDHIEPYDLDMRTAKPADKLRWWFKMRIDIKTLAEEKPLLVALYTGSFERERVIREFVKNDVAQVIIPFEGLGVGQRQSAVYDCIEPFDLEKARTHKYAIHAPTGDTSTAGNKYKPPATQITDPIEWE